MTDDGGTKIAAHDFYPFGTEMTAAGESTSGGSRKRYTGHERDETTGLDYMLARYYGSNLGRFLSVDPVVRTSKAFSPANWNRYSYSRNDPLAYADPDGREEKRALEWMTKNLRGVPAGLWYQPDVPGGKWRQFEAGVVPGRLECYQACWTAYRNVGSQYGQMPFSRSHAINWFQQGTGNGPNRILQTNITKGEAGDVLFMGKPQDMQGHAVLVKSISASGDGRTISVETIGQYGAADSEGNPILEERTFTATKNDKGNWEFDNGMEFVGFGQVRESTEPETTTDPDQPLRK